MLCFLLIYILRMSMDSIDERFEVFGVEVWIHSMTQICYQSMRVELLQHIFGKSANFFLENKKDYRDYNKGETCYQFACTNHQQQKYKMLHTILMLSRSTKRTYWSCIECAWVKISLKSYFWTNNSPVMKKEFFSNFMINIFDRCSN